MFTQHCCVIVQRLDQTINQSRTVFLHIFILLKKYVLYILGKQRYRPSLSEDQSSFLNWISSFRVACELWLLEDGYRHAVPLAVALAEITIWNSPPITPHIYWSFPGNGSVPVTISGTWQPWQGASPEFYTLLTLRERGWAGVQLQMFLCIPGWQSDPHFLSGSAAVPLQLYKDLRSSENLTEWSRLYHRVPMYCSFFRLQNDLFFSLSCFQPFLSVNCTLYTTAQIISRHTCFLSTSFYC